MLLQLICGFCGLFAVYNSALYLNLPKLSYAAIYVKPLFTVSFAERGGFEPP